ncbi:VOC family protein [Pedobacter hartonius]|uniref:Glyoxalase/Bleomycin resistance protein/Dioxygenase superfamily protein n=1 Tax=Pedobacter hartonius TaxID=425514 RepID=A0A1H4BWC4_9SPHI|nr:VOC family protein [Pedobacter hartonius]SEA52373.1 Glyoxalase/Bleomycin resistance protein/Dioxygenase superfamily protein [Pedobacter hartonius]
MISKELNHAISIHHIVLTVVDAAETEKFYTKIFGDPMYKNSQTSIYTVGTTKLILMEKTEKNPLRTKFDPKAIGLEHLAFGLKNLTDLEEVERVLNESHIANSGIHIDTSSKKEKIWLNDPSNIRIEFYL